MPRVGFEPMIPAFERAKAVHALDRTATVIGHWNNTNVIFLYSQLVINVRACVVVESLSAQGRN
jgi:hypothetical protein